MSTYYGLVLQQVFSGGTYIRSIRQTKAATESGGTNEITATLTNGRSDTFYVKNGEKGDTGDRGEKGDTGDAAGFAEPEAHASTLAPTEDATASVVATGGDTAKTFTFEFGIPRGTQGIQGETGAAAGFGEITATARAVGMLDAPTASVEATGGDTEKSLAFEFGIPTGAVAEASGLLGLWVDGGTGNLMLAHGGEEPPALAVEDGNLTYTYEEA